MKLGKEISGDEIAEKDEVESEEAEVVEEAPEEGGASDGSDVESDESEPEKSEDDYGEVEDDVENESDEVQEATDEYGEVDPICESRTEREIRLMTEQRNAPEDVNQAKWADKQAFVVENRPKASFGFRLAESFISATSWPAAVIVACLISIWIVTGYCSISSGISAIAILVMALAGYLLKKARLPMFSLIQDDAAYKWTGKVRAEGQKNGEFKTVSKVQRRSFKAGEYGDVFASIILVFSFAVMSIFIPTEFVYFLSMIIMFGITWSMSGNYISACAPFCDVYDVEFSDDSIRAMVSFDTPVPGEERYMTPLDKTGGVFAIRSSTRTFLEGQSNMFTLDEGGHVIRRKLLD